ncbi:4a-hydroxytetrahydrobiopterin dehydratase domain protein [Bacteroidales bacterium KA00344]|nr:4a-hydroxytetrahydrobiopterin dehydratase domain protein [Bacteroidales bacterium KA00344]
MSFKILHDFFVRAKIHIISRFCIPFYKIKRFLQVWQRTTKQNLPSSITRHEFHHQGIVFGLYLP